MWVCLSARFLSNGGCCRLQTGICGYVQRALGTVRVWNVVVKEQRVHGESLLKCTLMCTFLVKAESGGYQTWICGQVRGALGTARVWSGVVVRMFPGARAASLQGVH